MFVVGFKYLHAAQNVIGLINDKELVSERLSL